MTEEEKIKSVLYCFEDAGLISKDIDKCLSCFSTQLIGIGIGEQGFVKSKQDVQHVFETGVKDEDSSSHTLEYNTVEIIIHQDSFAVVCAEITVVSTHHGASPLVSRSKLLQSLSLIKEQGEWRICALHASTPVVTEESLEAYPLKFAEKTLQSLKEKIGEEAYLAEEQYRQAVLADTIAFYIINFTRDIFEKSQLNSDFCVYVDAGTPYETFIAEKTADYVLDEDRALFMQQFSRKNIFYAFDSDNREISCEYRMPLPSGAYIWVVSIIRLITDVVSGDLKGIMYVKNIDKSKRNEMTIYSRATYDGMTGIYNKSAIILRINELLADSDGTFVMLDLDDFKAVNDNFGHPIGDEVLIAVARELQGFFSENALIGRLGGDEFGIYLPQTAVSDHLFKELRELLRRINKIRIPEASSISILCSIGGAHCDKESSFEDIYKKADAALYLSKKGGKNQVSCLP